MAPTPSSSSSRERRGRRGFAIMLALALIPVLGFTALVVDIGMVQVADVQLQGAADAGALAGVAYLDGTAEGVDIAVARTQEFAAENDVLGEPVRLDRADVVTGHYDPEAQEFTGTTDPLEVNAIHVDKEVDALAPIFSGVAFDAEPLRARASSLARVGPRVPAGESDCFLPLAIPQCMLADAGSFERRKLQMSSAQEDNTGWANPFGNVSARTIRDQLEGPCEQGTAGVGETVDLQNGEVGSAYSALDSALERSDLRWDDDRYGTQPAPMGSDDPDNQGEESTLSNYGNVIEGPVVIFDNSSGQCGAEAQYQGEEPVTGFAWGVVYDVDAHGDGKNLRMQLDLTYEHVVGDGPGGTPGSNVTFQDDHRLVF